MELLIGEQRISLDDVGTTTITYKNQKVVSFTNDKNILIYINPEEVLSVAISKD